MIPSGYGEVMCTDETNETRHWLIIDNLNRRRIRIPFSALTILVGQQKGLLQTGNPSSCPTKNNGFWSVKISLFQQHYRFSFGGPDLTWNKFQKYRLVKQIMKVVVSRQVVVDQ